MANCVHSPATGSTLTTIGWGKGKREKRQQKEACNLDWGIWMSCSCNVNEMFTLLKLKCKGERDKERQGGSEREICISSEEGAGESQLKNQND